MTPPISDDFVPAQVIETEKGPTIWSIGATSPHKVIHRASCRYGRHPYIWAGLSGATELIERLVAAGAEAWHTGGLCCSSDIEKALYQARQKRIRRVLEDYLRAIEAEHA